MAVRTFSIWRAGVLATAITIGTAQNASAAPMAVQLYMQLIAEGFGDVVKQELSGVELDGQDQITGFTSITLTDKNNGNMILEVPVQNNVVAAGDIGRTVDALLIYPFNDREQTISDLWLSSEEVGPEAIDRMLSTWDFEMIPQDGKDAIYSNSGDQLSTIEQNPSYYQAYDGIESAAIEASTSEDTESESVQQTISRAGEVVEKLTKEKSEMFKENFLGSHRNLEPTTAKGKEEQLDRLDSQVLTKLYYSIIDSVQNKKNLLGLGSTTTIDLPSLKSAFEKSGLKMAMLREDGDNADSDRYLLTEHDTNTVIAANLELNRNRAGWYVNSNSVNRLSEQLSKGILLEKVMEELLDVAPEAVEAANADNDQVDAVVSQEDPLGDDGAGDDGAGDDGAGDDGAGDDGTGDGGTGDGGTGDG